MSFFETRSSRHEESERLQMLGVGLLVGAILGAASALLLAPASGSDTRRALAKRARSAYREGQELVEDGWEDAERAARRAARSGARRARREAARLRAFGEEAIEDGRKRLRI